MSVVVHDQRRMVSLLEEPDDVLLVNVPEQELALVRLIAHDVDALDLESEE